jgi:acetylglutamate kinase
MDPALGLVGRIRRSNPALLDLLVSGGFLPVVACVAGDGNGRMYNVNADQMAAACAAAWRADRLIFLTDIEGVLDAAGKVQPVLTAAECSRLIAEGIAAGGMQAKLNAATAALDEGIAEIDIAPGALPNVVARLFDGEPVGTRIARPRAGSVA